MKNTYLTLSSTNEELLYTMHNEGRNVEYWHKKHYGGPRKYDKWQSELLEKATALPAGGEMLGELIDYHSLITGNRWKTFEVTTNYGISTYTRMFKFCYYDTYGSVGAFYNCTTPNGKHGVLVFPSHFFLRYADRMDIHHRDAALVCEFFNRNHVFALDMSQEPDEDGRRQFIIGAKEGVCYGFSRTNIQSPEDFYNHDHVFEVRTFLRYEQLSKRQREECQRVRDMAEHGRLSDGAPDIHTFGRLMHDEKFADEMNVCNARLLGLSKKEMEMVWMIYYAVVSITDFVSGDMRRPMLALANGEVCRKSQAEGMQLTQIIVRYVREHPDYLADFNSHTVFTITHEWKGDSYDWNKWLWSLLHTMRQNEADESHLQWFDEHLNRSSCGEYTLKQIEDISHAVCLHRPKNKKQK